jgi:NitT/TauT family transport system substrate-binding protein
MKFKHFAALAATAALVCLLAGCGQEAPKTLHLGTNVWPGYEPLHLARNLEGWQEDNIRLVEYPSATEVLRAFRNRSLEAASLTLDEVLLLRQDDIPIKVVLVHDISAGGDVILARPNIDSVKSLRGKRVGLESNALGAFVITRALELNGLDSKDIEIVPLDVNTHESAYLDNRVDAVVTFEPVRTKLLNAGAKEIFSSLEIPNEIVDVLVVHEDYIEKSPQVIRHLVEDWFEALAFMEKDMNNAAHILAQRLKVRPEEVIASFDGLHIPSRQESKELLGGPSPKLKDTLKHLQRILVANALIDDNVDIGNLLTADYIDDIPR